mgnify:CR=1 FL=1
MTSTQKKAAIGIVIAALIAIAAIFGVEVPVVPGL